MKTNTREEIHEILRDLFVDRDLDNSWGTQEKTDQILALVEKQKKEERERIKQDIKEIESMIHDPNFQSALGYIKDIIVRELEKEE